MRKAGPTYPGELPPVKTRERLHEKLDRNDDLEAALDLVHAKLVQSTLRVEQVGDGGRFGVALAMDALIEFFSNAGLPRAALRPLFEVQCAIVDARRGVESPIFRPDRLPNGGAPPTPASELEFEGYLAVITECCVAHFRLQRVKAYMREGCKLAEQMIHKSDWPVRPTSTELREIRERVRSLRDERPDNQLYWIMMNSKMARERPLDWAHSLLQHDWVSRPAAKFLSNP